MRSFGISICLLIVAGMMQAQSAGGGVDAALLSRAQSGDAAAEVAVGEGYAAGKDLPQAANWYRMAAEQGSIDGELHLAALLRDGGKGLPRNMEEAARWYRKAAEAGNVKAQATLGVLYSMGQGVPHNDVEAYFWLDVAAHAAGPDQQKYAANRQMIGTHITTDELEGLQERLARWLAAHPAK